MNFEFAEEQQAIAELAREILAAEATHERVKGFGPGDAWFDADLWKKLAEANLLGIAVPEAYGGMGFGFAELCVLLTEIGRQTPPVPALAALVLGTLPLVSFGSEAQRSLWLPKLVAGDAILSAALVDADSADVSAPATRADAQGEGFRLDGVKRFVPWAHRAERVLVPAQTERGVRIFLVDPRASGTELVSNISSTGEPSCELILEGVAVARDDVLGAAELDAAPICAWLQERALVAIAALQVGVSDRALEITAGYVREREQFGQPIGAFQAVQHRAADAFVDLAAMRWTMWQAAWRIARDQPAAREAMVAKFWAAEAGSRIANASLHLHAGLGSDVDYPIQRYFLWSKSLELSLGGATLQLARLGLDMARTGPQELA